MLQNSKAFSSFSVDDLGRAKSFYGSTLGLRVSDEMGGELLRVETEGGAGLMIYPKPNHSPATYTVLNFPVPNVDRAVSDLVARGVVFEKYDTPDLKTDEGGVCRDPHVPNIAWFKDPAGNILSVLELKG